MRGREFIWIFASDISWIRLGQVIPPLWQNALPSRLRKRVYWALLLA
jgi:hypothetical protein